MAKEERGQQSEDPGEQGPAEERELIRRVLAGERDLFEILIARYQNLVVSIVCRRMRSSEVQSTAHDVFVRAYRSLRGYRAVSPFSHWLARIAIRECYDIWRRESRKERVLSDFTDTHAEWIDWAQRERSLERLSDDERRRDAFDLFHKALRMLSPEERAVLVLIHVEERSVKESAEILGWSRVNVKVRAYRARTHLRRIIESLGSRDNGR